MADTVFVQPSQPPGEPLQNERSIIARIEIKVHAFLIITQSLKPIFFDSLLACSP